MPSPLIGAAGILIVAAGCGSDDDNSSSSSSDTTSTAAAPAKKAIKVGLVTDIGGLNDRSFNSLANKGLEDSKATLGVTGRVLTSKSNADYVPNLSTLAQQKYDLVIGVGFLMADAVGTVAKKFPDTKFAIIDVDATSLKGKPTNVEGLLFKEQQSGYLAGYLAGLYAKDNNITTISSVGGQKIPPVDHYIAGYQAGAKAANPDIKTLNAYSQDFVDQAKCKEIALSQIARGSGVVFQVAGQCGLGALDAAKEKGKQGIGVDADQSYLGALHPDLGHQEGRRRGARHGQAGPGRQVHRRDQHHVRGRQRRRGPGQDQRGGRQVPAADRRGDGEVEGQLDHAAGHGEGELLKLDRGARVAT